MLVRRLSQLKKYSTAWRRELTKVEKVSREIRTSPIRFFQGVSRTKDLMVPCKVYRGLTYEMEAELCYKLDKSRKRLSLAQSTIALTEAGTDAEVMDIMRLIEENGFLWTLDKDVP